MFQILSEKWRFRKNPHNYAMKKTLLLKQKVNSGDCLSFIVSDSSVELLTLLLLLLLLLSLYLAAVDFSVVRKLLVGCLSS